MAARPQARHGLEIEEVFGYSQGIRADGLIYIAGQVPRDASGRPIPEPGLAAKFAQTVGNIDAILRRMSSSLARLAHVQIHLMADLEGEWPAIAALTRNYSAAAQPAGTLIQVNSLNDPSYLVEISAVAASDDSKEEAAMTQTRVAVRSATGVQSELGFSQAVRVGKQIFVSGQMATDETGRIVHEGSIADQFRCALDNFAAVLVRAGATLDDVVATHMFLTRSPDAGEFGAICAAHRTAFGGNNRPTGTMVYVPKLPLAGAMVQIAGVAVLD